MSKIGHNNPPRKIDWKSISLNKYTYEDLEQIRDSIFIRNKLHAVLDKKHISTVKKHSIPETIEICVQCYWLQYILPDTDNVYQRTLKSLSKDKDFKQYAK